MANVSVGMAAVQGAQNVCSGAIQDLNSAAQKLSERYRDAGRDWKDKKYEQLGGIVNDCTRALRSPVDGLFECVAKLQEIERILREYDETNL